MENVDKSAEEIAATAAAKEAEAKAKAEADAKNLQNNRTEKEKAEYSLKKNADRVKELGGDPSTILGIKKPLDDEDEQIPDDTPVTFGKLKDLQKREAQRSALDMAEAVTDELERAEIKKILESRIVPSGNAEADFTLAKNAVNSEKNRQIAEEVLRKSKPNKAAAGGSAPGKFEETFEPTAEEQEYMAAYGLTKDQILETRRRSEEKRNR